MSIEKKKKRPLKLLSKCVYKNKRQETNLPNVGLVNNQMLQWLN